MELSNRLDYLIDGISALMPSPGPWPFSIIKMKNIDFKESGLETTLTSEYQILVVLKSDFSAIDLVNYAKNSKEFLLMPSDKKEIYIELFANKINNASQMQQWTDMVVNIAIGLITYTAKRVDVYFSPVDEDLSEINNLQALSLYNLKAYQLFNAYHID
ncbi:MULTISPECIES: hypothetical protein [Chryseobacterium]|uniref:hypothetical protein n=1 Tax=Chryseobacterium TaxID=59732 RepID=UPI00162885AC|nr:MULTISPECIES: hypothetical protein [Chryseobacterium]MBF6643881.1 hypothetical protein [Chryseobacterium indologenes]MBU3047160.1 hypothetical protein [Chryseobacterium indologenes]QQQ72392.1 hypothetical protein JHW31_06610 [Chryseobacterium indologenes]WET50786.1 hypothetical protein PYS58_06545 [Chryseobacterium indologenes]